MVPPLIFERPIAEILTKMKENEMIVVEEGKGIISLLFPSEVTLSENTMNALRERAAITGYVTRTRPGAVVLTEEARS